MRPVVLADPLDACKPLQNVDSIGKAASNNSFLT